MLIRGGQASVKRVAIARFASLFLEYLKRD